jgi:hypothetical protein
MLQMDGNAAFRAEHGNNAASGRNAETTAKPEPIAEAGNKKSKKAK